MCYSFRRKASSFALHGVDCCATVALLHHFAKTFLWNITRPRARGTNGACHRRESGTAVTGITAAPARADESRDVRAEPAKARPGSCDPLQFLVQLAK
jgi:hypothetical protein